MTRKLEVEIVGAAAEKPVVPSKDELQLQRLERVAACASALVANWSASGFYDRQDPADALALHEALQ